MFVRTRGDEHARRPSPRAIDIYSPAIGRHVRARNTFARETCSHGLRRPQPAFLTSAPDCSPPQGGKPTMSVCPSREEHVRLGSVDPQPAFEVRQWTCSPPARGQPMVSACPRRDEHVRRKESWSERRPLDSEPQTSSCRDRVAGRAIPLALEEHAFARGACSSRLRRSHTAFVTLA